MSSGGTPPDHVQTEVDTHALSRQWKINNAEDDIVHDHAINDGEDLNENKENDDWMEGVHDDVSLTEQDFDDANDTHTSWDRNHDFVLSMNGTEKKTNEFWNQQEH